MLVYNYSYVGFYKLYLLVTKIQKNYYLLELYVITRVNFKSNLLSLNNKGSVYTEYFFRMKNKGSK